MLVTEVTCCLQPVRDLQVQVMIGREHKQQYLWANQAKSRNRGFTFVVTAYSFSCEKRHLVFRNNIFINSVSIVKFPLFYFQISTSMI